MTQTTQEERDIALSNGIASYQDRAFIADAIQCAAYERACVRRSEGAPEWAENWERDSDGDCYWLDRWGTIPSKHVKQSIAPDLRPDLEGPVTLPVMEL